MIGYKGKWMTYRHRMSINRNSVDPVDSFLRCVIFFWKGAEYTASSQSNTPEFFQILDNGNSITPTATTYLSPYSKEWGPRYKVIYDQTFAIAAGQTALVLNKVNRRLKRVFTAFPTASGGATNQVTTNLPYIMWISSTDDNDQQPIIYHWPRLSFISF